MNRAESTTGAKPFFGVRLSDKVWRFIDISFIRTVVRVYHTLSQDSSIPQITLRNLSGNRCDAGHMVCVESYPQVFPQLWISCGQFPPSYPQADSPFLSKPTDADNYYYVNLDVTLGLLISVPPPSYTIP